MPQIALAAYSIYQGVQAGKQADKDRASRDANTRAATEMGLEDRKYYRDKFGPVSQMLIDYAMGNKPSPYLAKAKAQTEAGYVQGMTQLKELEGRTGLGGSGIGKGQEIGLGMEKARINAGLDLQDQAQRYGVAQSLSQMENSSLAGSQTAARGYGMGAEYNNLDANRNEGYQNAAFSDAAKGVGSYFDQLGKGGTWYGVGKAAPGGEDDKKKQSDSIEAGAGWSMNNGVGAGGFTGKIGR